MVTNPVVSRVSAAKLGETPFASIMISGPDRSNFDTLREARRFRQRGMEFGSNWKKSAFVLEFEWDVHAVGSEG